MASYEFDAWGAKISPANTGGVESQKTFVGGMSVQDEVAETGLMMMGHRFYAPDHGRFLNRDPIGFRGGLNLFEYASNSPVQMIDAAGLNPGDPVHKIPGSFGDWTLGDWIMSLIPGLDVGYVNSIYQRTGDDSHSITFQFAVNNTSKSQFQIAPWHQYQDPWNRASLWNPKPPVRFFAATRERCQGRMVYDWDRSSELEAKWSKVKIHTQGMGSGSFAWTANLNASAPDGIVVMGSMGMVFRESRFFLPNWDRGNAFLQLETTYIAPDGSMYRLENAPPPR